LTTVRTSVKAEGAIGALCLCHTVVRVFGPHQRSTSR
jgi:hypothetical protein